MQEKNRERWSSVPKKEFFLTRHWMEPWLSAVVLGMRLPHYFLIHLLLITRTESQQPRIIATPRSSHRPASSTSSSSSPQHPSFSENAQQLLALAAKHGPNPSALSRPHDIQDVHRKVSNHPRRLLGPSELHAKNCPNGGNVGGVCEKAPTAMY